MFGPDYYARQAKSPSGAKAKSAEINGVSWPPQQKLNDNETNIVEKHFESKGIHKAITAVATTEDENDISPARSLTTHSEPSRTHYQVNTTEEKFVTKEKTVHHNYQNGHSTNNLDVTTSDSDLSYINFYDVEHSQVIMKTKNEDIKIPIKSASLVGTFKSLPDVNGNDHQEWDKNKDQEVKPIIKERPLLKPRVIEKLESESKNERFYKKASVPIQRNFGTVSAANPNVLKRHMSESDLLDSFDAPFKVLHPKKDNTIIAKIYKDHRVRQFASSSKEDLTNDDQIKSLILSQHSVDAHIEVLEFNKKPIYHSTDDLSSELEYSSGKTGKMSFFSSEEDLLSVTSDAGFAKHDLILEKRPESRESYRSNSSGPFTPTTKPLSTRKFIYSSSEDLLSNNEEIGTRSPKKDNTLISKIYKDPNVRKVALNSRYFIPDENDYILPRVRALSHYSSDDDQLSDKNAPLVQRTTHPLYSRNKSTDSLSEVFLNVSETQAKVLNEIEQQKRIDKEEHTNSKPEDSESEVEKMRRKHLKSQELRDVQEVAKKKLVNHILGRFSEYPEGHTLSRATSVDDLDQIKTSVKDLRRKFENNNGKSKHVVSSLTARSLSKQMKESLKE